MSNADQPRGQEQAVLQQILNRMDEMTNAIDELKADNEELRSTLSAVQNENRELHSTVSAMQTENRELHSTVSAMRNENRELQDTIRQLQDQLEAVQAEEEGHENEVQQPAEAPPQDEVNVLAQRIEDAGDDPVEINSILTDILELVKKHKKTILVGVIGGAIGALLFAYGVPLVPVYGAAVVTKTTIAWAGVATGGATALLYDEVSRRTEEC